tara:strand:+ start:2297 stop:4081 length:1785 start_codon:yes stop_codon:yes gene_type:complete
MKILRLLNRIFFSILVILFIFVRISYSEEKPVDIWNIDKLKPNQNSKNDNGELNQKIKDESLNQISTIDTLKLEPQNPIKEIKFDQNLNSQKIKILGLYDPDDFGLSINMWSNSDGDQLKNIFAKLNKMDLSHDAKELMNISLLTNAYQPQKNISDKEFIEIKSEWLIKNSDLNLIENYLIKNQIFDTHPKLTRHLVDQHLSKANLKKVCEIFSKNKEPINDNYLSKFNIYCMIKTKKNEEAQLILDLKKELGFKDIYFEKKIFYLLGYSSQIDETISENSILDFHLAHQTNPKFFFEPKETTERLIWKYLSSFNLLGSLKEIDISELDKISIIEKATNDQNYSEEDLFELYKRFQFNLNQLLNVRDSLQSLSNIEARALVYQKILLESEKVEKLKLLKILKESFKKDNLENAFDNELKKFLNSMDPTDIPDNLTSFYYTNIEINKINEKKIKFSKDVMHQSKLINYFNGNYPKSKLEKDLQNFLKKIKKNKKYSFSKKDQIFLESLKSDGIDVPLKYDEFYEINQSEIPSDIQVMINNNEKGAALLRIIEVIGQDDLNRIDDDTIYFIIATLNQLNIDKIRNDILLKVLPLKV